jgi:hypothetical protein
MAVIALVEKVSTAWRDEGAWITKLHLYRSGKSLRVRDMREAGECRTACKTIEAAADAIVGSYDTDIAEMLFLVSALSFGLGVLVLS